MTKLTWLYKCRNHPAVFFIKLIMRLTVAALSVFAMIAINTVPPPPPPPSV